MPSLEVTEARPQGQEPRRASSMPGARHDRPGEVPQDEGTSYITRRNRRKV